MFFRIFFFSLLLTNFLLAKKRPKSIDWNVPEGWKLVEVKEKHFPYVFVGPDNLKISLLKHQYRPDAIWVISKVYREQLGLALLTEDELAKQGQSIKDGTVYYKFFNDEEGVLCAFYRNHGYLWILKFDGSNDQLKKNEQTFKELAHSLKPDEQFSAYLKELQSSENKATSALELSLLYDLGLGLPKDQKKAFELLLKWHKEGNSEATYRLGSKYLAVNNLSRAFTLLSQAADGGHLAAIKKLAALYIDYKKDTVEGFLLLKKAAEKGDTESMFYLGTLYAVERKLKDPKQAFKWISMAAKKEWLPAVRQLGVFYRSGFGVEKNVETALKYLNQAANKGDSNANEILADMYRSGEVEGKKDYEKSRVYLMKAALGGSKKALLMTAEIYLNGEGVKKDVLKGLSLLEQAAAKGLVEADLLLGDIYTLGKDVTEDFAKAYIHYKSAAEAGDKYGMFKLAIAYLSGKGCKKDGPTAVDWLKKSAKLGYAPAIKALKDTGF